MQDTRLTVRRQDGYQIITLAGDVDHSGAADLEVRVRAAIEPASPVVIDLAPVTFLDSAGLRLLDRTVAMCADRNCPVRIVAPDPGAVRFTLELIGFRRDLLTATAREALADLADEPDHRPVP